MIVQLSKLYTHYKKAENICVPRFEASNRIRVKSICFRLFMFEVCKVGNGTHMPDEVIGRMIAALLRLIPIIRSTPLTKTLNLVNNGCFSPFDRSPSVAAALIYALKGHLLDYILVQVRAVNICLGAAPYISSFTREGILLFLHLTLCWVSFLVYPHCLRCRYCSASNYSSDSSSMFFLCFSPFITLHVFCV